MVTLISDVRNDEAQRKMGLAGLFSGAGYKVFKEELDAQVECANVDIENRISHPVYGKLEAELNEAIGFRKGLNVVLNILGGLKEELENESAGNRA